MKRWLQWRSTQTNSTEESFLKIWSAFRELGLIEFRKLWSNKINSPPQTCLPKRAASLVVLWLLNNHSLLIMANSNREILLFCPTPILSRKVVLEELFRLTECHRFNSANLSTRFMLGSQLVSQSLRFLSISQSARFLSISQSARFLSISQSARFLSVSLSKSFKTQL